jgi:uncharacterized repeat protein (TIGR03847 family)
METEDHYEYNEATLLSAFAVGAPGKRTFFLAVGEKNNWLRIWLEKEHLQALALGVEQLFFTLSQQQIDVPEEAVSPSLPDDIPSGFPSAELDIIQATLSYDEEKAIIELIVERSGSQEKNLAQATCRVHLSQLKKFGAQATRICAAGRPLCPICGGPVDPSGHVCPKQN